MFNFITGAGAGRVRKRNLIKLKSYSLYEDIVLRMQNMEPAPLLHF